MRRALTLVEVLVVVGVIVFLTAILYPTDMGSARHNARRASCQSNLKQIGLALQQYTSDYDEYLPLRTWAAPVAVYARTDTIFQCPETNVTSGTTDYFFNARFVKAELGSIKSPATLILIGDGQDDAPLNATLTQLPAAWRTDKNDPPSFRHLGFANYLFADGHVKSLNVRNVSHDFRMVTR